MSHSIEFIGPDDAPRIRDEHAYLDRMLDEVIELSTRGAFSEAEQLLEQFRQELEIHLGYEEAQVFPGLVARDPGESARVERLLSEHAALRLQLSEILVGGFEKRLLPEKLVQLAASLHRHEQGEIGFFGPWLSSLDRAMDGVAERLDFRLPDAAAVAASHGDRPLATSVGTGLARERVAAVDWRRIFRLG